MKKTSKAGGAIVFVLIFFVGASILFYPKISFWLAERNQVVAVQSYTNTVSHMTEEEKAAILEKARDYNARTAESLVKDPFSSTENINPFDEYFDTLELGGGMMGYIRIPGISALLPIYHGTSDEVLEKGVGHIKATALPIGGAGTHCVLTGHRGLRTAKMFNDLAKMKEGDLFFIEILDHTMAYQVDQIDVVEPGDISKLKKAEGKDYITLITCTPYGVNSHRLLVRGERTEYSPEMLPADDIKLPFPWWILGVVAALLFIASIIVLFSRKKKRKARQARGKLSPARLKSMLISGLMLAVFAAGTGILMYPALSNYVAKRNVVLGSVNYENALSSLPKEEQDRMREEAVIYNNSLKGEPVEDPFIPGSGTVLPENYRQVLNIGDSVMGYIHIPGIGVYLPIRHGASDEVLERGAGHVVQTALPIGGAGNHPIITAHTAYVRATMFNRLIELKEGDKFLLYVLGETLTYQVNQIEVIEPEGMHNLKAEEGEDYVSLVTCTPYGVNSHRLVVRGTRVPNEVIDITPREYDPGIPWDIICIAGISLLVLTGMLLLSRRMKKEKKQIFGWPYLNLEEISGLDEDEAEEILDMLEERLSLIDRRHE
ncbi:MAG: class C sortase [Oscillospiraceae bacterium]|nr:class C sortase [Oscillospiraceae bacterium]